MRKIQGGEWEEVRLKGAIKALVLLNLQSYGGGRDLWGLQDVARDKAKGWQVPIFNDGLIEVRWPAPPAGASLAAAGLQSARSGQAGLGHCSF